MTAAFTSDPSKPTPPTKAVLDRAHRLLGTLKSGPGHGEGPAESLFIRLDPDAQALLGLPQAELVLPSDMLDAIRRQEVVLDRDLEDLRSFLVDLE